MNSLLQDVRYGFRMLLKSPGFALVAVLALALGIGANTAIFSVVNTVLLRPLPYESPERLVMVWATSIKRGIKRNPAAYLDVTDWQKQNHVFDAITAYSGASATLMGKDAPERLQGVATTVEFFKVLGIKPAQGRGFLPEEAQPGAAPVVVISHGLWQRHFGADPGVVGKQVMLDGMSTTVIGIMPRGFSFPLDIDTPEFWSLLDPTNEFNTHRGASYLSVVARLKPGVSLEQAQGEMNSIAAALAGEYRETNENRGINLVSLHEEIIGDIRPALLVLLGAVGFVLLIACSNVANLLLARAASRGREIAIRTALGASRFRVVRQLLTESLLLALFGGSLGLLLALWGVDLLIAITPEGVPRFGEISLDARVLSFTLGISVLTGLIFGLAPALQASKLDLTESLKEGGRSSTEGLRRNRVRSLLVIMEVALSLILLIGAGLLIKSFLRLRSVNPGFSADRVMTATLSLPEIRLEQGEEQQMRFFQQVVERLQAIPGVTAAGAGFPLPLSGNSMGSNFTIEGRALLPRSEQLTARYSIISPDYLRAMGIPLIKGRAFTEHDNKNAPDVFLINETFARKFFSGEDPIGKQISVRLIDGEHKGQIVGLVGDVKLRSLEQEAEPQYYMSYQQTTIGEMSLVARAREDDPHSLAPEMRNVVLSLDRNQPLADVRTMNALLADALARRRFNVLLLASFACVALTLASIGIFGVMNYSVTQRTHEIGIRMALGAQSTDVLRLVVGQGMMLTALGICLGLLGAFAVTRVMSSLLYGVSATDPLIFAGVSVLLTTVALVACYIPARRAMRVDPMVALRYE